MGALVNIYFKRLRIYRPGKELGSWDKTDLEPGEKCEWVGPDGYLSCDLYDSEPCSDCMTTGWHRCSRGYYGLPKDIQEQTYLPGAHWHGIYPWVHAGVS